MTYFRQRVMAKDPEQIKIMSLTKKKIRVIQGDHNLLESKTQVERIQRVKEIIYNHLYTHPQHECFF